MWTVDVFYLAGAKVYLLKVKYLLTLTLSRHGRHTIAK